MPEFRPGRRVAVVAGLRSPFVKSGTVFRDVTAVALARHAVRELLVRSEIDGREVDEVIFSQVVPSPLVPNVAREVSLLPQLLPSVPAYTLNRACASAAQAITNAADQIALGHADAILAGGVESLSDIPILHSRRFSQVLVEASKARSLRSRAAAFAPGAPTRPGPADSRDRGAVHRRDDGAVRREDGQGERDHARGAGPTRAAKPSARRCGHGRRPAPGRDRALVRRRRDGSAVTHRQRHPVRYVARSPGQPSVPCSTASTGR